MVKFNKWALAIANTVALFYTAGALALYFWGERAMCWVEKMHMIKMSSEMMSLHVTFTNYIYGLVSHFIFAYVFVALAIAIHGRLKK